MLNHYRLCQSTLMRVSRINRAGTVNPFGVMGSSYRQFTSLKKRGSFAKGNIRLLYKNHSINTSDDELNKKIVIKNFANRQDTSPNIIDIDTETAEVRQISRDHNKLSYKNFKSSAATTMSGTFLPNGYPESVRKGYLTYTLLGNLGAVSFTAMGFLSTQCLFVSIGGSQAQAGVAAAAFQWVLKDVFGPMGAIFFAAKFGKNFDADVKKWRFYSLVSINVSNFMEIAVLAFPQYFLLIASTANIGKNISFMLSSASRSAIHLRFAKQNNIADIQGKSVSQYIASNLLGYGLGMTLSKFIDVTLLHQVVPCFLALSFVQMITTQLSNKYIEEIYMNNQRANLVFDHFFEQNQRDFPTIKEVNMSENFYLPDFLNNQKCNYIQFGANSIGQVLTSDNQHYTESMLHQLEKLSDDGRKFIYHIASYDDQTWKQKLRSPLKNTRREYIIHFNLQNDAEAKDVFQSYFLGRMIDQNLQKAKKNSPDGILTAVSTKHAIRRAEWEFKNIIDLEGDVIPLLKKAGWSYNYIYLDNGKNRFMVQQQGQDFIKEVQKELKSRVPDKEVKFEPVQAKSEPISKGEQIKK